MAYQLRWAGKMVLISGRIPVKPDAAALDQVQRDVAAGPAGSSAAYTASLERLLRVQPDLWLPAVPVHGQNANLYDREWTAVLAQNRQAFVR